MNDELNSLIISQKLAIIIWHKNMSIPIVQHLLISL